jgi:hypothetical protein
MPMDGCSISDGPSAQRESFSGEGCRGQAARFALLALCGGLRGTAAGAGARGARARRRAPAGAGRHGRIPPQTGGVHLRAPQIRGRGRRLLELRCRQAPAAPRQASQQPRDCARRLRAHAAAGLFRAAEADRSLGADRRAAAEKIRARGGGLSTPRRRNSTLFPTGLGARSSTSARMSKSPPRPG